jgi:hypothetical protein
MNNKTIISSGYDANKIVDYVIEATVWDELFLFECKAGSTIRVINADGTSQLLVKNSDTEHSKDYFVSGDETTATIKSKLGQASTSTDGWLRSIDWNIFNNKQASLGYTPVTNARTLTINGVAQDLTVNRTWSVGDLLSSGSYSNPTWITSLAWSKLTGTPTTVAGYGITDAWQLGGNTLTAETIIGGTSGAFGLDVRTNNLTALKVLSSPTSAVNYLGIISSITTVAPTIEAFGTDTNINIALTPKGTQGTVIVAKAGETSFSLKNNTTNNIWSISIGGGGVFTNNLFGIAYNGTARAYISTAGALTTTSGIAVTNYISCFNGATVGLSLNIATVAGGVITNTSGTLYGVRIWNEANNSFAPTTGTASMRILDLSAFTINQTGTASGDITMINVNPTFTSNTGVFSILRSSISAGTNRYGLYINYLANYLGGNTSIGTTTSTATLTIGASTSSQASLRVLAGALPTTSAILDGNIDYNGTDLYLTKGTTTQYVLVKSLSGSATLDFPSTNAGAYSELTITITGASIGDKVFLGTPASSIPAGNCHFFSYVSATNTVTIRFVNSELVTALDPSSGTFNITVQKH